jgi:sulfane dehydrogenase subunit SoxC
MTMNTRRRMLVGTSAVVVGAMVAPRGRAADDLQANVPPNIPEWMKHEGLPLQGQPYTFPSKFEKHVARKGRGDEAMPGSGSIQSPLQDLRGMITPSGLTFERSHAGVPEIDPTQHRLIVHGLVKRPLILTMDDIVRFPSVSRIHFLECSGNSSREWRKPFGNTVQITHGLISCCEWTGVLLSTVLQETGLLKGASWVLAEGADACALSRSVPIEKCFEDAMLVYGQNGEMLRPQQGYPLRLFLPGFEGNMNVKWLRRLKVGNAPFMTREETSKYTDSMPDGSARQFTFIMEAKSVITHPSPGFQLKDKGFYEISGLAWSGMGQIRRVDVSVDGGRNWREAQLQQPILNRAAVRFRLPWMWDGGEAILQSRAMDSSGYVQPTRSQLVAQRGYASQYHYNAIQSWKVGSSGELTNVHA